MDEYGFVTGLCLAPIAAIFIGAGMAKHSLKVFYFGILFEIAMAGAFLL